MYKHILTPLDGSPFAESVLPYVVDLARGSSARVTLLMVVPQTPFVYAAENLSMLDELRELDIQAARRYLAGVVKRLADQGLTNVDTHIDHGRPADSICANADGLGCDLIAMTTHGRSGFSRMLLGSVADRVLHIASQPVFLARNAPQTAPQTAAHHVSARA